MGPQGLRAKLTEYGDREFAAFIRRSFAKSMGLSGEALGKPVVGIIDTSSGTAFGTVVLHVAPEAAAGGPLGLARSGDRIALSVKERRLDLLVAPDELERRRAAAAPPAPPPARGYERLYFDTVEQAHLGADFGFLRHESLQAGRIG